MPPAEKTLDALVSPYVGVVRSVGEMLRAADDGAFASFSARPLPNGRALGLELSEGGGGWHLDAGRACAAALGEAAERYSASFVPPDAVLASADEFGSDAVDPRSFALFSEEQYAHPGFPFVRFGCATRVRWVPGLDLRDGRHVLLPAQLVHLPRARPDEALIGYATSSGLAAGWTFEQAALAGLLELVERDAFVLVWRCRLSLPHLDEAADADLAAAGARLFGRSGLDHVGLDASLFTGLPVVIGVVRGPRGEAGALGVGGACAATVREAWTKALVEAFASREYVRDRVGVAPELVPASAEAVETFDDHVCFYAYDDAAEQASFLAASLERRAADDVEPLPGATPGARLRTAVDILRRRGIASYAADVTTPDLRRIGLVVVRVVCPQLCPLDVPHRARYEGGERLCRAAFEAGLRPAPLTRTELNPDPHPFP